MTTSMSPNRSAPGSGQALRAASFALTLALTLALAILAGCGGRADQAAPVEVDAGRGDELYAANCSACHGSDLRGTERGPSQLSIVYEPGHHNDDSFRSAIAEGAAAHHWEFGDMPAVGGLDSAAVDSIISFIRSEQQREGFEPYERP